ncbi:hypothetical protein [Lacrimispora defluvii]|uniref:Glycosyltransferase family 4 protein n=1 Tax=Lacrimispora defluvii TaxID=2719233 RepID=A0ABX1W0J7_9FIRM|nr:hypothetical protein [Lacrimispora defluvii]NNJ32991.1 glycosyltransferase family 4 protein [Lacrimispora defluvii]
MKVCIVTYDEYINIPYISKYERILKQYKIEYDVILWDRRNILANDNKPKNYFVFNSVIRKSKISKVIPFYKWSRFTLNILKTINYDKIIVLTTLPAILIYKFLIKKYHDMFLLDIRDFTYENINIYKKRVDKLISKSALTFISSEGFKSWLNDSNKLYLTHNISNIEKEKQITQLKMNNSNLVIGFVGGIRYYKENCKIIDNFKNKSNIQMLYVGKTHAGIELENYCEKNNIYNVSFKPAYQNIEKPFIYEDIDFINSIYGSDNQIVKTALPNKLYDCILFKKPIIVSSNTYLSKIVNEYNLGFDVNLDKDNLYEKLLNYVEVFDDQLFLEGCNALKNKVLQEEKYAEEKFIEFIE